MVPIASLWLPILLSAVAVFIVSSVIHMFLGYHTADYKSLAAEDEFMAAVRKLDIPPGDYMVPCPTSHAAFKDPAFLEKFKAGPRAMMTVLPGGPITMAPQLVQWFLYAHRRRHHGRVHLRPRARPWSALPPASSGSRARPPSTATASRSSRRPSGTRSPGGRRSGACSTAWSTRLVTAGFFGWLWPR